MFGSDTFFIPSDALTRDPTQHGALGVAGRLVVQPAAFWCDFSPLEISAFCVQQGLYHVPTAEFCAWLRLLLGDATPLEIGAGNGVQAEYLGMRAVDNHMQTWPDIKDLYREMRQTPVPYGPNVEQVDALVAAKRYRPDVAVAAWLTHKYDAKRPAAGGNMYGVDENKLLKLVKTYVHIGHSRVHALKLIRERPHRIYTPPGMVCRALTPGEPQVWVWGEKLPGELRDFFPKGK